MQQLNLQFQSDKHTPLAQQLYHTELLLKNPPAQATKDDRRTAKQNGIHPANHRTTQDIVQK